MPTGAPPRACGSPSLLRVCTRLAGGRSCRPGGRIFSARPLSGRLFSARPFSGRPLSGRRVGPPLARSPPFRLDSDGRVGRCSGLGPLCCGPRPLSRSSARTSSKLNARAPRRATLPQFRGNSSRRPLGRPRDGRDGTDFAVPLSPRLPPPLDSPVRPRPLVSVSVRPGPLVASVRLGPGALGALPHLSPSSGPLLSGVLRPDFSGVLRPVFSGALRPELRFGSLGAEGRRVLWLAAAPAGRRNSRLAVVPLPDLSVLSGARCPAGLGARDRVSPGREGRTGRELRRVLLLGEALDEIPDFSFPPSREECATLRGDRPDAGRGRGVRLGAPEAASLGICRSVPIRLSVPRPRISPWTEAEV